IVIGRSGDNGPLGKGSPFNIACQCVQLIQSLGGSADIQGAIDQGSAGLYIGSCGIGPYFPAAEGAEAIDVLVFATDVDIPVRGGVSRSDLYRIGKGGGRAFRIDGFDPEEIGRGFR